MSILHGYNVIDRTIEREDIMSVKIMFMDLSRCRHLFKDILIADIKWMSQFRSLAKHYHINWNWTSLRSETWFEVSQIHSFRCNAYYDVFLFFYRYIESKGCDQKHKRLANSFFSPTFSFSSHSYNSCSWLNLYNTIAKNNNKEKLRKGAHHS